MVKKSIFLIGCIIMASCSKPTSTIDPDLQTKVDSILQLKMSEINAISGQAFNEKSDIDMVVDFDKVNLEDYADNYFNFKYSLEDLFGREVDLLEDKAIRNPILRRNIDNSKLLVYGWISSEKRCGEYIGK